MGTKHASLAHEKTKPLVQELRCFRVDRKNGSW